MGDEMQGWTMGLAVIGLMATAATAKGEADERLTLRVLAVNQADVPDHILKAAELEGTRMFSAMGIRLLWIDTIPASDGSTVATGHHLTVNILSDSLMKRARRATATDAMGEAPRSHDRRPTVAYAFYRRIEDFARQHETDVAKILADVIAHEMGHLLLPHDSHTLRGVMRARLDRAQWEGTANGLAFSRDQAELIRTTARAKLTNARGEMPRRCRAIPQIDVSQLIAPRWTDE
jgi:hypothetical protein